VTFTLTDKQHEANAILASKATHIMLAGGSRSGKTFLIVRAIVIRALKAPGSRHAILRFRLGHVKQSIVHDTFPKVMQLCFPQIEYELNKSDLYAILPGGSEIWFGGLDDKQRTEKILGTEFASIFLEECSQITYGARNMVTTRLAQLVHVPIMGKPLPLKMYYAENPPDKGHWTYKLFKLFEDPESRQQMNREDYAFFRLNPGDNQANLSADYIKTLKALPERMRRRFLEGEFRDQSPNALFNDEHMERWRNIDGELPDMLRIVVAVDPSGADDDDNIDNDEIGIVVCGLGVDGNGYVLEDLTCKAGPQTASRGKVVRAEPISALVECGKIRMAGVFRELEDELVSFTTHGYMGENSPNRADAMIWAFSDLFPELTKAQEDKALPPPEYIGRSRSSPNSWMRF